MEGRDLIWVPKEFAAKYKKIESDEEKEKVLDEYIQSVSRAAREDFKCNLDSLEEDAVIFSGLMMKVKKSFEKAKNESLNASYSLWEEYQKELPDVDKKVGEIISHLQPLTDKLNEINSLLNNIRMFDIKQMIEVVSTLSSAYGRNKEMVEFLVKNFGGKE